MKRVREVRAEAVGSKACGGETLFTRGREGRTYPRIMQRKVQEFKIQKRKDENTEYRFMTRGLVASYSSLADGFGGHLGATAICYLYGKP